MLIVSGIALAPRPKVAPGRVRLQTQEDPDYEREIALDRHSVLKSGDYGVHLAGQESHKRRQRVGVQRSVGFALGSDLGFAVCDLKDPFVGSGDLQADTPG
jgi:hypothetical protein